MPHRYDRVVLMAEAEGLYLRANWIAAWYVACGLAIGFAVGFVAARAPFLAIDPRRALTIVGGAVGIVTGLARGSQMRFRAQAILCAVETERHLAKLAGQIRDA